MLPKVSMGGVYQISTGSYNSTVDVNSGIAYVQELMMLATGQDRFALIPLLLERVPRKTGGGPTGVQQTHYTLRLTCDITLEQLAQRRKDPGMIHTERMALALPEPLDENPELDETTPVIEEEQPEEHQPPAEAEQPKETVSTPPPAPEKKTKKTEQPKEKRQLTTEITINGTKYMTAGITTETIAKLLSYKEDHNKAIIDYLETVGADKLRELTEEEGVKLIHKIECAPHMKRLYAIMGNMGLRDDEVMVKKEIYRMYGVSSLTELSSEALASAGEWLEQLGNRDDFLEYTSKFEE
jgi:hypothetical protein